MTRLISGIALLIILALPVAFGPAWMFLAIGIIIIPICIFELMRACLSPSARIMGWIVCYGSVPYLWFAYTGNISAMFYTMIAMALGIMAFGLILFEKGKATAREMGLALSCIIYPLTLLAFWLLVRNGTDGRFWLVFGFLCTFLSDTGAYYVGKNFGKRRLAAKLSPKKTWEGLFGGIATSIIGSLIYTQVYPYIAPVTGTYPIWLIVILSITISVLDLVGDLTASMFKREYGIKDMGNLIPGHGGMLDRMDGVVPVGAALYIILQVLS